VASAASAFVAAQLADIIIDMSVWIAKYSVLKPSLLNLGALAGKYSVNLVA
jgi:hypothetical protein